MARNTLRNRIPRAERAPHRAVCPRSSDEINRFLMPDGAVRLMPEGTSLPFSQRFWVCGRRSRFRLSYRLSEDGGFQCFKHGCFPFLTSTGFTFDYDLSPSLLADESPLTERLSFVETLGALRVVTEAAGFRIERTFYPAVLSTGLVERVAVLNLGVDPRRVRLTLPHLSVVTRKGHDFPVVSGVTLADEMGRMLTDLIEEDSRLVPVDGEVVFHVVYWSKPRAEDLMVDCRLEWKKRMESVAECFSSGLVLSTPEPLLNRAFSHALLCAAERLADAPSGVLPYDFGCWTDRGSSALPLMALCGLHRASLAAKDFLSAACERLATDGVLPVRLDVSSSERADGLTCASFALAVARYSLLTGSSVAAAHFGFVERFVERFLRTAKGGLYTLGGRADLGCECVFYALLTEASRLAFALGVSHRAAAWQEAASALSRRIDEAYLSSPKALFKRASLLWMPLACGVDGRAEEIGRALIVSWLHEADAPRKQSRPLSDWFDVALALARVGYADAAHEMLRQLSSDVALGAFSPYPAECGYSAASLSWRYVGACVYGLLGLEILSFERIAVCLHLPGTWDRFFVRGVHIGASVLRFDWERGHLRIQDIFGRIYYDDSALCGQHVEVALTL